MDYKWEQFGDEIKQSVQDAVERGDFSRLYQNGQLGAEGVLVCTLSALSSFGPVVALANLGASLTQVFASADRVLDLLDEEPVTADMPAHIVVALVQV